jgi:hypothetical protein
MTASENGPGSAPPAPEDLYDHARGIGRLSHPSIRRGFTLDYGQLQLSGAGKARTNLGVHTATGIVESPRPVHRNAGGDAARAALAT